MNTETVSGLTKLENLPENQDLLESRELSDFFPEWKELSPEDYYLMLKTNSDLDEKSICPNCFHRRIIEDFSTNEIVCIKCGYVIGDEIVSLKERVKAISTILKEQKDKTKTSET